MASSPGAARLTAAYQRAQARLGENVVRQLIAAFRLLDPTALDATIATWLRVAVPLVLAQRQQSTRLAATYLTRFRELEIGDATAPLPEVPADARAVMRSLVITGPVNLKTATAKGVGLERAVDLATAQSAAAGMRHALNGGRDLIAESVQQDDLALGWARQTRPGCCAFCAAMASRGYAYKSKTTAEQVVGRRAFVERDGEAVARTKGGRFTNRLVGGQVSTLQSRSGREIGTAYHDSCQCFAVPLYNPDAALPPRSQHFADLWHEAKTTKTDHEVTDFNAFRRLVEGRPRA